MAIHFSLGDFCRAAALGLHGCAHVFSSCGQGGSSLVTLQGLLTAMASLLWSTGSRASWLQHLWRTGLVTPRHVESSWTRGPVQEPMSPALQGKLLTIGPPGQPPGGLLKSLETLSLSPGIPLVCISPKWHHCLNCPWEVWTNRKKQPKLYTKTKQLRFYKGKKVFPCCWGTIIRKQFTKTLVMTPLNTAIFFMVLTLKYFMMF